MIGPLPLMKHYSPPSLRVLWVDDRPEDNGPFAGDLERRGIQVSVARSTNLALVLLARNKYMAVISDMGRAEGPREGFHLLDSMRARGDGTPFYIFASLGAPALKEEASRHDAQGSTNDWGEIMRAMDALALANRQRNDA
jgi:DNA-binding NtrC family response regulator